MNPRIAHLIAMLLVAACCVLGLAVPTIASASERPSALPNDDQTPIANPLPRYRGWVYFIPPYALEQSLAGTSDTLVQPLRPSASATPMRLSFGALVYIDGARGATQLYGRPVGRDTRYVLPITSLWIAHPLAAPATDNNTLVVPGDAAAADLQLRRVAPIQLRNLPGALTLAPGDTIQLLGDDGLPYFGLFRVLTGANAGRYGVGSPAWWRDGTGRRVCC